MDGDAKEFDESLLKGEKRLLEMVARGSALGPILDAICRVVEETVPGSRCGILFLHPTRATWELGAAPTLPAGYNESMNGRPAHRESGPCGLAASQMSQVIVSDVASDTRWAKYGWTTLALEHGLRSCWSSAIPSQDQRALGALALYQEKSGSPTSFQCEVITRLTHIASIAVERTRSESALKRSEAFLAEAQRLSVTGSFSWLVETNEVTWSEQAHRIFALRAGERTTLDVITTRVYSEDLPVLGQAITRMRTHGGDVECRLRLQMPNGALKHLHIVAHGARNDHGQLECVGAVQDITERHRSEEALGALRAELAHMARSASMGALTASIAHEVSQPLAAIVTNAGTCMRMLAASSPNLEGARETARRTMRDANRASDVITGLRAMFMKTEVTTQTIDLNEATREVIALCLGELQRKGTILRTDLTEDLPPVTGDRVQLQQVILNLLQNAADAMSQVDDRPRQLVVTTAQEEAGRVRLSVRDAGVGIAPEHLAKLFDPFYSTKSGGMGIGLSVSRSIVDSHHGSLWAHRNDGPGASFTISLPCTSDRVKSPC